MRFGPVSGAAIALFVLTGCGGGGGGQNNVGRGEISGVVFDGAGKPVRGATVFVDQDGNRQTTTDSLGAYVLKDVAAEDLVVGAQTFDGAYVGANLSRVFEGERDKSVNIALYAKNSLATVYGKVTDGQGHALSGVRVFARPTNGAVLSSSSALTGDDGVYTIDRLAQGVAYRLLANNLGKGEATTVLTPSTGQTRQDLALGAASNPTLPAPLNLEAVAYTTTGADTTRVLGVSKHARAMESVKRLLDPTRAARQAKAAQARNTTLLDEPIEVDLFWNEYTTTDTYGFGIYRIVGSGATPAQTFLHDPLAVYYDDGDEALHDGVGYSYRITAISSSYDSSTGGGESPFSNSSTVTPLSELVLRTPVGRTVSWAAVSGASGYTVYAYDQYPDLGITPISTTTTSSTSLTVPGTLASGRTYYYIVVGARSDNSAQVLSPVDTFVP